MNRPKRYHARHRRSCVALAVDRDVASSFKLGGNVLAAPVGKIVGHENGRWIVQSGNDGQAVRTRPRSLAGAIAFRHA
jgi:hypothetical protein